MIRKIVSYLIKVQVEKIDLEYTKKLLSCEVQEWIPPAPPDGLILMDVIYKGIKFQECLEVKKFAYDVMKAKINNLILKNELYKNFVKTFKP
jgi:tRNA pseudouridine38-40 synthase